MAKYDEIPQFICHEQGICPDERLKYEFIAVTDEKICYFFGNHTHETKVLIKFDAGY